jgi:hypothetical protein
MASTTVPVTAQAFQYIEKFGVSGGRALARRLAGHRVQTREQKALVVSLWREINRRNQAAKGA